jgi:hypothetical protein
MFVARPAYVREAARKLRLEKHLSVDQIAARLALPRTTISYWLRDLPAHQSRGTRGQRKGNRNMGRAYAVRRAAAYLQGRIEFGDLITEPTFRDFVCLYMAEGYKRSRNTVRVGNSDPAIVVLCAGWVRRFSRNRVTYWVQYHADQDLEALQRFWSMRLGVEPDEIRHQRKSNSGRMDGRRWRSRFGVLTVSAGDTLFRARLEAWMHSLQDQWLHSLSNGA